MSNAVKILCKNEEQNLRYLFRLQRSGRTNMYGAASYLVAERGMEKGNARALLQFWMDKYDEIALELGIEV